MGMVELLRKFSGISKEILVKSMTFIYNNNSDDRTDDHHYNKNSAGYCILF